MLAKGNPFIAILVVFAAVFAVSGSESGEGYHLTIAENPSKVSVKATIRLEDDILYVSSNGAGQFPDRWANFVKNLRVVKPADPRNPLNVEKLDNGRWRLPADSGELVVVTYDVALEHEKHKWSGGIDGAAYKTPTGIFHTGRSLFIANGRQRQNIPLEFSLPRGWTVSGSWKQVSENRFVARNVTDLLESMLFAGTHKEFKVARSDFEVIFALNGQTVVAGIDRFEKLAKGVLDYYIGLMGDIPKPPPGSDLSKVLVVISEGASADGEVIGKHISMIFDKRGTPQSKQLSDFIFAHEFFHLWNGKSIRIADTTEDWFKEGVTSYYTLKALKSIGELDERGYFGILNALFYKRYRADSAYGTASMRDLASGFNKGRHWGLIYGGGLFVGLCQDISIRNSTQNKRSLNDLLKDYFQRLGGTNNVYRTSDIQDSATALSGIDQADFFKKYVFGVKPVPIQSCLSSAGLIASTDSGELKIERKPKLSGMEARVLRGILH